MRAKTINEVQNFERGKELWDRKLNYIQERKDFIEKLFLNEGSSQHLTVVGKFNLDQRVRFIRSNGAVGKGFISSVLIYSNKLGNKDEISISTDNGGTIVQIQFNPNDGKYYEMDNGKEIIIKDDYND